MQAPTFNHSRMVSPPRREMALDLGLLVEFRDEDVLAEATAEATAAQIHIPREIAHEHDAVVDADRDRSGGLTHGIAEAEAPG